MEPIQVQRWRRLLIASCVALAATTTMAQEIRRLVVPSTPGSALDASARLFAQQLAKQSGHTWLVENRPGANSQVALEAVTRAPADGSVLLFAGSGLAFMHLQQKMTAAALELLTPVVQLTSEHYVLVTAADSPFGRVRDIEQSALRGTSVACAAPPGPAFLACEQLRGRWGAQVVPTPYPGSAPALAAVLGGHAQVLFVSLGSVAPLITSGKLRVLARTPGAAVYDAPILGVIWPGFLLDSHFGVLAPARTPQARVDELNAEFNRALSSPEVSSALGRDGGQVGVGGAPELYESALRGTLERYGPMLQRLGVASAR